MEQGQQQHSQRRIDGALFHSLWRLKLSAARWWPAASSGETVHLTGLTSVSFHLLTADHLLLSWLSRCPAVRKAVFQPGALTDTDGLRGSQVNYSNAAVAGCCFLLDSCMLVLSFAPMLGENHINLVCWECPAENWCLGCSSWKVFFFLLFFTLSGLQGKPPYPHEN